MIVPKYNLWPILLKWITYASWTRPFRTAGCADVKGASWLELAIVFTCQTGMTIADKDTSLSNSAKIFATCFRRAAAAIVCRKTGGNARDLLSGCNATTAVHSAIGFPLPGITRRPIISLELSKFVVTTLREAMGTHGTKEFLGVFSSIPLSTTWKVNAQ